MMSSFYIIKINKISIMSEAKIKFVRVADRIRMRPYENTPKNETADSRKETAVGILVIVRLFC
jgi:hypothetical protein